MIKRIFDFLVALVGLCLIGVLLVVFWLMASVDTQSNGLFIQERIGQLGTPFNIYKLKTMHPLTGTISWLGNFFRKSKIDELPQLWNVLKGDMSLVGPRPDVAGYYDLLVGDERKILELKPGLTSLASIKYYNEDALLASLSNPLEYNDEVIFPDKVQLNLDYYYHRSFYGDLLILIKTLLR
ncbi:sugar transferase [Flavobacterium sp.]|uniref:sugar transferase n=1 Tax=Flavobacterium sp. TaxID=239 RepID=UPI0037A0BA15